MKGWPTSGLRRAAADGPAGSRLSQTAGKGTPPTSSLPIDASTNRVVGWSCDAAGNTTNDGRHAHAYDAGGQ